MKSETLKQLLMDQVIRFIGGRIERARQAQAEAFVRQFYANVPVADLAQESPEDLFCAALSLWQFAHKRQPGVAKVRVFNPLQDEHGWGSSHTVIEIVNDDMSFLVDWVTAELARQDLEVHLVVHPIMHIARNKSGQVTEIGKPDGNRWRAARLHQSVLRNVPNLGIALGAQPPLHSRHQRVGVDDPVFRDAERRINPDLAAEIVAQAGVGHLDGYRPATGAFDTATLTATPGTPALYTAPNTSAADKDEIKLTTAAAFNVSKSIGVPSVAGPGNAAWPTATNGGPRSTSASCATTWSAGLASSATCQYTVYTLTFNNTGGAAGKFAMSDTLPSGMTYVAGSAVWSRWALGLATCSGALVPGRLSTLIRKTRQPCSISSAAAGPR